MTTGSETIAAAIRDGLHELAEWLREARRETPRMGPVAANTPEPDPVGTPEAAKPSGTKSFPVMVSVDTDEIEEWAGRMADANRHGVAHVLYRALELIEAGSVDWLNPDGQPPTPRPMTVGQLKNVLAVGKQLPRRRAMTARTIAHEALTVCPACDKPIIAEAAYDLTLDAKDEDDYGWIPLDDNEEDE